MRYLAKTKYELITQNTLVPAEDFGGWSILNYGETVCVVNGVPLDPNGAAVGIDYTSLHPDVIWSDNISIKFIDTGTGGSNAVILTRIKYTKVED